MKEEIDKYVYIYVFCFEGAFVCVYHVYVRISILFGSYTVRSACGDCLMHMICNRTSEGTIPDEGRHLQIQVYKCFRLSVCLSPVGLSISTYVLSAYTCLFMSCLFCNLTAYLSMYVRKFLRCADV